MSKVTLGKTGITLIKNAFGALPIQRVSDDYAVMLLRKAYDAGFTFFDTARYEHIPRKNAKIILSTKIDLINKLKKCSIINFRL